MRAAKPPPPTSRAALTAPRVKTGRVARQRRAAKLKRDRATKAKKPSKQVRFEQPGVIVLPAVILGGLQEGNLAATHLLVLTIVIAAVENKCAVHAYMRYDEDGSV